MALLRFKQTYLASGFDLDRPGELPDHLCVVLEYAATVDQELGRQLMLDHRAGLELLRLSLRDSAPRGRACSTRSPRPCRRCAATSGTPYAAWPPRGRPRRRSGSRRYATPQFEPPGPTGGPAVRPARCRPFRGARRMDQFLWVVFPYICLTTFVVGHFWRYRYDKFGWTTRSSQLYENRLLRIGSPLFHFGIIGVFFGHVIGLRSRESWTEAVGRLRGDVPLHGGLGRGAGRLRDRGRDGPS